MRSRARAALAAALAAVFVAVACAVGLSGVHVAQMRAQNPGETGLATTALAAAMPATAAASTGDASVWTLATAASALATASEDAADEGVEDTSAEGSEDAADEGSEDVSAEGSEETSTTLNGWVIDDDGATFYFVDGVLQIGWQTIGSKTYYFNKKGVMQTGWKTISGKRYYFGKKGVLRTGWKTIGSKRYYFGKKGVLRTGWKTIGSKRYYFGKKGVMRTGWKTISGKRYYFGKKGVMRTGWKTIGSKTYYFKKKAGTKLPAGAMLTGLRTISGATYYFNKKGVMRTGWKRISGEKYYFRTKAGSGQRKGAMLKGHQTIGGKQYYFGGAYSKKELAAAVKEQLSHMTLKEKIAQMFIVEPEALTQGSTVTSASSTLEKALETYPVGGIVYFSDNLKSTKQTKSLLSGTMSYSLAASGLPLFLAVDEEGGTVARIAGNSAFGVKNVGNMSAIGATGNRKKAYKAGRYIGSYLSELGFNLDFAPVADVLTNSSNTVVKYRSFGSSATLVSKMVSSEVKGLEEEGVLACIKHFPGHGATSSDTHSGIAYVNKTLTQLKKAELVPFADQVEEGVSFIMVGHISLPKVTGNYVPASLSKKIVTGVLRKQMGYSGVVVTDALNMGAVTQEYTTSEAAVKAVKAGVDIMLMPSDFETAYKAVYQAVKSGEISEKRINTSVRRILKVKMALNS